MPSAKAIFEAVSAGAGLGAAITALPLTVMLVVVRIVRKLWPKWWEPLQSDLRWLGWWWLGGTVLSGAVISALLLGLDSMCGVSRVSEYDSPDKGHRLMVYNCDCGATTDFSFNVALMKPKEKLEVDSSRLYSRYHMVPNKNFDVSWNGDHKVIVHIEGFVGEPLTKQQDGVDVILSRKE